MGNRCSNCTGCESNNNEYDYSNDIEQNYLNNNNQIIQKNSTDNPDFYISNNYNGKESENEYSQKFKLHGLNKGILSKNESSIYQNENNTNMLGSNIGSNGLGMYDSLNAQHRNNTDLNDKTNNGNNYEKIKENKKILKVFNLTSFNPNNYPTDKLIIISKNVKGYVFRIFFRKKIKEELENFADEIYSQFTQNIAKNDKVDEVLYDNDGREYASIPMSDFYENDEGVNEKYSIEMQEIKKIKKYKNGLKCFYSNKSFTSSTLKIILDNISSLYKGEVNLMTNQLCGIGELKFRDGRDQYGTWKNDFFSGWNRFIDKDGNMIVGLFENGELNGMGIKYSLENKYFYKGNFVKGLKEGNGTEKCTIHQYEGEFKEDKKNGKGKLVYSSGDIYQGEFKDNKYHGNGHYIWKKNGWEYQGQYSNGKFHGKGLYKWSKDEYYMGDYKNGIRDGNGEIRYPNGKKFICPFVNGKPNGIGIYEDAKGVRKEVEFIDGKINKQYKKKGKRK